MKHKSMKLRLAFAIAKIAEKLYGNRLLEHCVSYSDDLFPYIRVETKPTKNVTRLGILQEADTMKHTIGVIKYCFTTKPYRP